MDQASKVPKPLRPVVESDWEQHRTEIIELYTNQKNTLKSVREHFRVHRRFDPSEKQWKNRIKKWNLGKYYKNDEAQRVAAGGPAPARIKHANQDDIEARAKAARSLKRKRARERQDVSQQGQNEADSCEGPAPKVMKLDGCSVSQQKFRPSLDLQTGGNASHAGFGELLIEQGEATNSTDGQDDNLTNCGAIVRSQLAVPHPPLQITTIDEKLLFRVYHHIHEAFLKDAWDPQKSTIHNAGRQAARSLASELAAGRSFFDKGKYGHAHKQWQKAIDCFKNPDLLNTWYHETPIRLLFELGRMVHTKHEKVAALLLAEIKASSRNLPQGDSRRNLFSVIGDLNVHHLRDLHAKAAKCQYNGLATRLDKRHQLLHEVKLNRALDTLWFDPEADLSEWMTEVSELDRDLGSDNPYSIYFMLLEAYRHVAQKQFDKADDTCRNVDARLDLVKPGSSRVDMFRVGLAYRRLGRQYHDKARLHEARTTMATALRHLKDTKHGASVLVEICQLQEAMALELKDDMNAFIWKEMLENMIKQNEQEAAIKAMQEKYHLERRFPSTFQQPRIQEITNIQEEQIIQGYEVSESPAALSTHDTAILISHDSVMQNPYILNQLDMTNTAFHQPNYHLSLSSRQSSFVDTPSPINMSSFEGNFLSQTSSSIETPILLPNGPMFEEPTEAIPHMDSYQMSQLLPEEWAMNRTQRMENINHDRQWQNTQQNNVRQYRPHFTA